MTKFDKRNNYVDGSFVDVDDFQTEQNFFLEKIRSVTSKLAGNGAVDLKGLQVVTDTTMAEPVPSSAVTIAVDPSPDITAPNPQNFTVVPNVLDPGLENFLCYSVFKTNTTNIQSISLRVTLDQVATNENLDLILRLVQLVDGSNPLSPLASAPPLVEIQLSQEDIPALDSDSFLSVDLSNENSGQGVAVVKNFYYAIQLEYRRPVNSSSNLRIFHAPLNTLSSYSEDLYSFVYSSGKYTQFFSDTSGIQRSILLYHKALTSAVQVLPGEAIIDGKRTVVEQDQFRFLEIPDRRNVGTDGLPVYNYVVLKYLEVATDPEQIKATRNQVNTRIKETSSVQVLSQPQWDTLLNDTTQQYLLLAVVTDTNIVSIFDKHQFDIPVNSTNLAFQDWLNPSNSTPTDEAVALKQARPSDFIFYVSNVPGQVPLTDSFGTVQVEPVTVRDEFGNVVVRAGDPILDEIVRVVVNVSLDNGKNTRSLELSQLSEIGTTTKFRTYAATISNLFDNPFDNVFTFNFNIDQLAPNVAYNFVAYTKRGLPIFIQDYNKTIGTTVENGQITSLRQQTFSVFLNQDSKTAIIEKDLQLGAFNPASDQSQPGITQFVPTLTTNEILTPLGTGTQEIVTDGYLTQIYFDNSFLFPSLMAKFDNSKIPNTDSAVQAASDAGEIVILVDAYDGNGPVDITFSGTTDRDRGGNGVPILINGTIDPTLPLSITTEAKVKVRNSDGRDNTNTSTLYSPVGPALVGGSGNIRAFNIIARGKNTLITPVNVAGFVDGEEVFIYIDDQQALDQNYQPISFIFNSLGPSTVNIPTIRHLGPKLFFREKQLKSIQSSTTATPGVVLIDTGLSTSGSTQPVGQVIFNRDEIPTALNPNTVVFLQYNKVDTIPQNIYSFKTKFKPLGTRDGFKIENANVVSSPDEYISVPDAIALTTPVTNALSLNPSTFQSVAFFVDGINITSLLSPIGQKEIVADDGVTLAPGQVAFNPEEGTLKFYRVLDGYTVVVDETPNPFNRLTASYFSLETRFVFNTSTTASYEFKFDINNDGRIDELDLNVVTRALGSEIGDPNYIAAVDFNNDGKVDDTDLALFQQHFGAVALGEPDYSDATSARLKALLVARQDNYLDTLKVIKAVSRPPDATAPNGRTVLFFDSSTPVEVAGQFVVTFGFQAAMSLGYAQVEVETSRPLNGLLNFANIQMFESGNPTNTREIIQVEASTLANSNNRYNSVLTFSPAINISSNYTIKAAWSEQGIAVLNAKDLVIPQKYEQLDRKVYGPFKLQYQANDFDIDGTSIKFALKFADATLADGSPDPTGTHIQGVPLSEFTFTAHLTIPNADGTQSIWTWHNLEPNGRDNKIKLEYDANTLFVDHQIQGKNKAEVLTPFGLGVDQVSLKPLYAGGDLQNDLSNISLVRSDVHSRYVKPHRHSSKRDGGLLGSRDIQFVDDLARLNLVEGDVTDAVYALLDIINEQARQIDILKSLDGVFRYDAGLYWDDPNIFYDT